MKPKINNHNDSRIDDKTGLKISEIKILGFLLLLGVSVFGTPNISLAQSRSNQNFCEFFGAMYIVDTPQQADYIVFFTDTEAFADLIIFEEDNYLMADDTGLWHFTNDKGKAQYYIYITKNEDKAHLQVYKTDDPVLVKCN